VYRYDDLIVLQRTHMPAALLEAGSIINRQEETILASPERRAVTSAAIAAAVEDFCTARATRHENRSTQRPAAAAARAKLVHGESAPLHFQPQAPVDRMSSH
jgi:hypothetical protein